MPIQILPPDVANKIAAGEVVERPASVVKELIENAIDANSTKVDVEIRAGGKRLIKISDNGIGMTREDALIAIERHATSKIRTFEDLEQIQTFGFRGEAIPSIASVSQFEIQTRTHDAINGTKIAIESGVVRSVQESGCSPGTQIAVNNLFYNVPARLKFLKTDPTEMNHITNQINWAALGNPQIAFSLKHNDRSLVDVRSCESVIDRIRLLYGKEFAENLIEIRSDHPEIEIHAFIGKPDFTKANRNYQLFFLNRRPIRSKILIASLNETMQSMISKGRHAVALIFLTMDSSAVDVNVHPAKIEVRFRDERSIYRQMVRTLTQGIYQQKYIPTIETETQTESENLRVENEELRSESGSESESETEAIETPRSVIEIEPSFDRPDLPPQFEITPQPPRSPIPNGVQIDLLDFDSIELKTAIFNTFIIAEAEDRLFIIDQHVAHERVIYETLIDRSRSDGIQIQGLLLPVTIEATQQQISTFDAHSDLFKKLGFDVEKFGGGTILVRSVPSILPTRLIATTVTDLLDQATNAIENEIDILKIQDDAMIMLSCKSAVKAGDSLSMEEMIQLIKDLSKARHPFNCPHARPIIVEMAKSELESRFKRQ